MSIPGWTVAGILPPIRPGAHGASPDRSPYPATMTDLVWHFGTTPQRRTILDGLLRYRNALHGLGMVVGFQWVDGSFLEEKELLTGEAPNDVDVVTFFEVPSDVGGQVALLRAGPHVFGLEKPDFHVDAYYLELGVPLDGPSVRLVSYWYSMWSHRRDGTWKGFLQIDLDPVDDAEARVQLDEATGEGGGL